MDKIKKTEAEWKAQLDPKAYEVLRGKGTERAFSGEYWDCHDPGTYVCAACGNRLFSSEAKYESGTGWPSFDQPVADAAADTEANTAYGMRRGEVTCSRCGGYLGHDFDVRPPRTGPAHCLNSDTDTLQ